MAKNNLKTEELVQETIVTEEPKQEPKTESAQSRRGLAKVIIKPTAEQIEALGKMTTTSGKIRYLAEQGYVTEANKYSGIANYLGLLTPHVRNVLTMPLKKG